MPLLPDLPLGPGGVVDLGALRAEQARQSAARELHRQDVRVELGPTAEPCYRCPCCAAWNDALNQFRQTVLAHDSNARRRRACPPDCQMCALAQGAYDQQVDPEEPPT